MKVYAKAASNYIIWQQTPHHIKARIIWKSLLVAASKWDFINKRSVLTCATVNVEVRLCKRKKDLYLPVTLLTFAAADFYTISLIKAEFSILMLLRIAVWGRK